MPRTAMSRSVIMPISRPPSVTGIEPAFALSMNEAASCTGWSGRTVWTSRVITSLTFIVALLLATPETNGRSATFRLLRHVLSQEIVGRHQLVALVEDLDRPANNARLVALQRFGTHRELHAHCISRVERGQEAKVLQPRIGENRARSGIDEQPCGEAQDQIDVSHSPFEDR